MALSLKSAALLLPDRCDTQITGKDTLMLTIYCSLWFKCSHLTLNVQSKFINYLHLIFNHVDNWSFSDILKTETSSTRNSVLSFSYNHYLSHTLNLILSVSLSSQALIWNWVMCCPGLETAVFLQAVWLISVGNIWLCCWIYQRSVKWPEFRLTLFAPIPMKNKRDWLNLRKNRHFKVVKHGPCKIMLLIGTLKMLLLEKELEEYIVHKFTSWK